MMRRVVVIIFILMSRYFASAQSTVLDSTKLIENSPKSVVDSAKSVVDSTKIIEERNAQLLAKLDKKNGFRDVQLGTPIKFFKKIVQEWQIDDDKNYRRKTDKLSINGMPLTEIVYGFYKGRLAHIYLTSPGIENSRNLLAFFQSIYGPGEQVYEEAVEFDNMIQWTGKKVILTYSEVASKKEGFFHFSSVSK